MTVVDVPERWDDLDDPTRLRIDLPVLPTPRGTGPSPEFRPATALRLRAEPVACSVDQMDPATAEAFARRLTPLGALGPRAGAESAGPAEFTDLLGLADVHAFEPEGAWRPRPARDRLRVPIGVSDHGTPVHLDLKESAQQGMGPHGLVIGATGSGKSEFLRTLVLGLAMTHSPAELNMVLVDFKGGATFAGMAEMPHVSAVITNLAEELTLVDRMQDALSGEMVRRQELLRSAGNFASVRDYEKARAVGEPLEPLPSLLIVVDEFSEMLAAKPEFIDLFVAMGRLGRSSGCTCCWPASVSRRGGCVAWSRTSPTGSVCAPSRQPSPAPCSASPTPTSCQLSPGSATSSPISPRWCASRRPTSRGHRPAGCGCAATRWATCVASSPSPSPRSPPRGARGRDPHAGARR